MADGSTYFLTINGVIMTICCRLRLLTCYPTLWFYQTPYYLDICRFMAALKGKIDEVWVLPINTI